MTKEEKLTEIAKIKGQGNQIDCGTLLTDFLIELVEDGDVVGDLASLETDHKSDIVSAINEVAEMAETDHYVISFSRTADELKAIYDECNTNIVLAKNIVFYNANDELYYRVNGYNMVGGVLKLHTIMQGESGLMDTVINLSSNGTLSVG